MRQPGASAHGTAAERLWRNTAAGGLPSEGSAFSGTLLRMLQISGTTVAELIDKLPSAVWTQVRSQPVQQRIACLTAALAAAQSEQKQVSYVCDGLGDGARRMYITEL